MRTGLSSLKWNGSELIARGMPQIPWVGLTQPDGSQIGGDTSPETSVDAGAKTITQKYQWGTVHYVYTNDASRFFVDVTIQNTSSTPVGMFIMEVLQLRFPARPAEYDGGTSMVGWNMGSPTVIHTSFGSGSLALTNEDVASPLMIGWPWALDSAKTVFPLRVLTGGDSMYPTSYPSIDRPIPVGASLHFRLGLRFGAADATNYDLAGDVYQSFAKAYPSTVKWTDRRPIASLFLTSYNGTYAKNPRRWFGDGAVDVTSPAGVAAFQQRLLKYADDSVAICKAEGAQGAITWDAEGEQFPQSTSYIGDPRLIETMAPEIVGAIDAYFKKFTDAGLKIGMTIRPQQLVLSDSNQQASQQDVADPGALMIQKIAYAHSRWGATLFYIDSNGGPDNPMDVKYFRAVAAAFPDVLLIPEQSNLGYYAVSAPYGQLNMGVTGTPPEVLWAYPQAFRVFTVGDADIPDNLAALVNSVRRGDALFFRGWFDSGENPQVKQIYQQAAQGAAN